MSTQNDVVSDVRAESALEYAAAISPRINIIASVFPKIPLSATAGNKSSGLLKAIPYFPAIEYNSTPSDRNIIFTKIRIILK